ncbi:DinB family protein [Olivibacter sp. SDN3]|uniref:DinB family protein n=1 Tax=Olivibacter sp. SDN3 TaxID=2764720 RepID=UPI0016519ECB|nr:DinB family protein [Olivibacter sp. SDN3]QNL51262.1 DinB family protein [Olivibacter sp. SDN3]
MNNPLIKNLVKQLQEVQDGDLWIDENFSKKIDHLEEDEALMRPIPEMHSVAEIISHLLEWRKSTIIKLNGGASTLTEKSPENWKSNDELKKIGWKQLKKDFYASQYNLIRLIEVKDDQFLAQKYLDTSYTYQYFLDGMIHHDCYHLGQIGIAIKLLKIQA